MTEADLDREIEENEESVWEELRREARDWSIKEAALTNWLHRVILDQKSLATALALLLSTKLQGREVDSRSFYQVFYESIKVDKDLVLSSEADLRATYDRDPACNSYLKPLLFYKGYQAVQAYRVANRLWNQGQIIMAEYMQSRVSEVFQVDIHPAAKIGKGLMIDHATGVVIGETAVVGDGVSLLHGVTLGGNGKEPGDRHPKIGSGTMIGAGASVLGNITIGVSCRIGAGSVVLRDVPDNTSVAGIPAKELGAAGSEQPARFMEQKF